MSPIAIALARQGRPTQAAAAGRLSENDPFAGHRQIAFRDEAGFAAGTVSLPDATLAFVMPHAEVLVVLSGRLEVESGGASMAAGPSEALVLPRGLAGTLRCTQGTSFAFNTMALAGPEAAAATRPLRLDPASPRSPSPGTPPEFVVGKPATCHALNVFTDESGLRAGVWDASENCERIVVPHRVHELMHFLEGSVTLTHRSGEALFLEAGDTVFVPRGAPYAWKSVPAVTKYYVVL